MSSLSDFVDYIDSIFHQESKDINAIKNSVEIFFEFYKKKDFFDAETVFFLRLISEKMKEKNEILDDEILLMLTGCFWGMCLEKFSERIKIEDYEL